MPKKSRNFYLLNSDGFIFIPLFGEIRNTAQKVSINPNVKYYQIPSKSQISNPKKKKNKMERNKNKL